MTLKIPVGFVLGVLLCIACLAACPWLAQEAENFGDPEHLGAFEMILKTYWFAGALITGAGGFVGLFACIGYLFIESPWKNQ